MWALKVAYYRAYQKVMKVMLYFLDWSEPQLLTGPGSIRKLPSVIKEKGIGKVMVVTDKGLMSLNLLDGLFEELDKAGISYVVYDGVQPNPSIENIEEAREMFVSNGCEAMIAFGGGSPMDCAKAACARVVRPNKTIPQMRGVLKVMRKLPPSSLFPPRQVQARKQPLRLLFQTHRHTKNMLSMTRVSVLSLRYLTPSLQRDFPRRLLRQQVLTLSPMRLRHT